MKTPLLFLLALGPLLSAAPPPLREQVSLNGHWPVGGEVPVYAGIAGLEEKIYERDVFVPRTWHGRTIQIEFGAVNFGAEVFVDGEYTGGHTGGWMPFAIDVTNRVSPGKPFRLKVLVRGPTLAPITDANGAVAWPVAGCR